MLTNTQLFPNEWKNIALSLQLQKVPEEWRSNISRTSIHSLHSWISCKLKFRLKTKAYCHSNNILDQKLKYEKLKILLNSEKIGAIDVSILQSPSRLFNSLIIQSCFENKLNIDQVISLTQ